jgi:leader peptidase (prepilin peptidase) / N-methyltransferase
MPLLIAFVLGCMIGSFLNVCILRMPKDESIVFPASHCMRCQKPIAWYDNIPVLSFIVLGAKCRHCRVAISWQYPLIETLTGALFALFYFHFGATPQGVLYLYLALCLLVQTVIDTRYKIIPDQLTLPVIVIGIAASVAFPEIQLEATRLGAFREAFLGALLGGGFLYAAGTIAEWILKKEAMGGGDVKLLAAIGAVLGWQAVLWTIFVSSLAGSVIGLYLRWKRGEELIPYGPYLALGAFLYMFVGPQAIAWYFGLLGRA